MESSDFANSTFVYDGFNGTVGELSNLLRETAVNYDSATDNMGKKKDPYEMGRYNARANALRTIADRIETAGSADAVSTMLAEQNVQFFNNRVINNVVTKRRRGGKSRKGTSRRGKSRKGKLRGGKKSRKSKKSRKGKTRRR